MALSDCDSFFFVRLCQEEERERGRRTGSGERSFESDGVLFDGDDRVRGDGRGAVDDDGGDGDFFPLDWDLRESVRISLRGGEKGGKRGTDFGFGKDFFDRLADFWSDTFGEGRARERWMLVDL